MIHRSSQSKNTHNDDSAQLQTIVDNTNLASNGLNRDSIFSVFLSIIPTASILLCYIAINALLATNSLHISMILYIILLKTLFIAGNMIAYMTFSSLVNFSVYWRSSLLTNAFIVGFMLSHQHTYTSLVSFGYYTMCLSFFHLSEFVITALFNEEVTTDSFLLNHSIEYGLAALASWTEFAVEVFLFPQLKLSLYTRFVGLFLVMFGELFRKLAMYTAGTNFNHYIQERKKRDHMLVKTGVYALVRHPSYFGWFFWSIGTQILLANPICTILYSIATWKFFKSRILYEEFHLIKFFGKEYINYQAKVPSGIPFVKGCIMYAEPSLD